MFDARLLQALADRLAGLPANGVQTHEFVEPLLSLWQLLDATQNQAMPDADMLSQWIGHDTSRLELASEIVKLAPGQTPPADPWQIWDLREAYKPRAQLQFLVEGVLTLPSLSILYGAPGSMKSLLLADMSVAVASGRPWLEAQSKSARSARKTKQAPVLWCDFDNGARRCHERFEALGKARALPDSTPLHYVSMPTPWLDVTDSAAMAELKTRVQRLSVQLVVIDNLGTVSGKADENSAEMVPVMSNLRVLAESIGCAVVVIHHQRKSGGSSERAGDRLRGHSSIEAALDLALLVEREEYSNELVLKSTKSRDIDMVASGAQFEYTHKLSTSELETARFWGIELEDKSSDQAIKNAILDCLMNLHPRLQAEIFATVKVMLPEIGVNRIRRQLDNLVRLGLVVTTTGARNARIYDLP